MCAEYGKGAGMKTKMLLAGIAAMAGVSFAMVGGATAAPLGAPRLADTAHVSSDASDLIIKTQGRRGGGGRVGVRTGGGRFVAGGGGGRAWRGGGGRGISSGAAIGLGVGAAALGILGAAAAANSQPYYPAYGAPAPVYGGGCYIVRKPMYDDWGNYLGRRRVRVCD